MNLKAKRRNIVARVMAAENKTEAVIAEARRAGVAPRTIERWVEAAKKAPPVGQGDVSENVPPAEKPAENPVLDKLLGGDEKPADGPPTPGEVLTAGKDAEDFCVDAYSGMRSAAGAVLVSMRYTPPLDGSSPEVLKLLQVTKMAELAIRANAPRLYPLLTKYASNWGALIMAIGADAIGMMMGLEGLAKSRGWTPAPKKPAAPPPSESYAEQIKPRPATVSTSSTPSPVPDPRPGAETIVDAPLPSPELVAERSKLEAVFAGREI